MDNFNQTQLKAIALLGAGLNYRQTALQLGIRRYTLLCWRKKPNFVEAVEVEKQRFIIEYRNELIQLKLKAVRELGNLLDDNSISLDRKIALCFDSLNLTKSIRLSHIRLD